MQVKNTGRCVLPALDHDEIPDLLCASTPDPMRGRASVHMAGQMVGGTRRRRLSPRHTATVGEYADLLLVSHRSRPRTAHETESRAVYCCGPCLRSRGAA